MNKNALIKENSIITIISLLLLLLVSCEKKINGQYIDAIGDAKLDTLLIADNKKENYIQELYIIKNNKLKRILSVSPLSNKTYVNTQPKVENIYIEANDIQSKEKGIRLLIRNTDLIPDYFFIDLCFKKNQWNVEYYGIMNTNSSDSLYIEKKKINRSLLSEFGEEMLCDPKDIVLKYFKN